jgi:hypothetical protein
LNLEIGIIMLITVQIIIWYDKNADI